MKKKEWFRILILTGTVLALSGCKSLIRTTREIISEMPAGAETDAVKEEAEPVYVDYSMDSVTVKINEAWQEYPDVKGAFVDEQKKIGYRIRGVSALGSDPTDAFFEEMKGHLETLDHVLAEPEALEDWVGADGTKGQTISMEAMMDNRVYLRQETILMPDKNLAVSLAAEYTDEAHADEVRRNLLNLRDSLTVQIGEQDYISNNIFGAGDGSQLCLKEDGSFYYYQDKADHSQNYFAGTYEVYYGEEAYEYLSGDEALGLSREALEAVVTSNMDGYRIQDGGAGDMARILEEMGITEPSGTTELYRICKDTFYAVILHNDTLILTDGQTEDGGYDSIYIGFYLPELNAVNVANTGSGNYHTWIYEGPVAGQDVDPLNE